MDEKSCVTFLLCDPGWYVHKPDVQNKWDDNTHTHTVRSAAERIIDHNLPVCRPLDEAMGVYYGS